MTRQRQLDTSRVEAPGAEPAKVEPRAEVGRPAALEPRGAAPPTIATLLERARSRLDRLSPLAAYQAQRTGALLIDTRCAELRRETGAIPGSAHVPLSVLYWRLDATSGNADPALANRGRQVVLVCAHGYSSSIAAATLVELGFSRATDIVGGFEAWSAAGLPVEPVDATVH